MISIEFRFNQNLLNLKIELFIFDWILLNSLFRFSIFKFDFRIFLIDLTLFLINQIIHFFLFDINLHYSSIIIVTILSLQSFRIIIKMFELNCLYISYFQWFSMFLQWKINGFPLVLHRFSGGLQKKTTF